MIDTVKFKSEYFDDELKCFLHAISIDKENNGLKFWIADGNCTDMRGAIRLATSKWPQCKTILTGYTDGKLDMAYVKTDDGVWVARDLSKEKESPLDDYARSTKELSH